MGSPMEKERIMRKLLVTTTAIALTLFVSAGLARAADVTTAAATMPGTAIAADKMIGRTVVNSRNEKVGDVDSVLIDRDGRVRYVIVGVGGFLGIGEKDVAVRWDQLSFADNDQKIIVNMTKDQLSALPLHRFSDPSGKGKVYAYDDDLKANPYLANNAGTTMATTGSATNSIDTRKLIGRNIKNAGNDNVGQIDSVLVDKGGNVRYVVVGVGGFLGVGEKQVALPWNALTITGNGEKVTANVTKEQLKAMPAYRYADPSSRGTVYSYDDGLKSNPYLANNSTTAPMPPLAGANSFTESQARDRIQANGYTGVTALKKDDQSIWRGTAMKDGKSVNVALDYKGNVVTQ
jgi:sporulation protein YlmC with PRC-barrel domain